MKAIRSVLCGEPAGEVVQGLRHHLGSLPRHGQIRHVGYIHVHEHLLMQLHKDNRRDVLEGVGCVFYA